ncbi:MAG TPA: hypothetical protein GXZ22_10580 [Clostridiaceae bacterium]|jgi:hypothetical protein|nr:hypothetical protein [Clostridiaceae bacterium]
MFKKTMVSLLSISLLATIIVALISPSSVMAAVGLTSPRGGFFEKVETRTLNTIKEGLQGLAEKMSKSNKLSYVSDDGNANITARKDSKEILVIISVDGSKLPEATCKDYSKLNDLAKEYLRPVLDEKQTTGLCSLFFGDAYNKYKNGARRIELSKKQEDISITCIGDTGTGMLNVIMKGALPEQKSFWDKLKSKLFIK